MAPVTRRRAQEGGDKVEKPDKLVPQKQKEWSEMTTTEKKIAAAAAKGEVYIPNLRREIGMADFVTMGNAVCGVGTIFLCLNYLANENLHKYIVWAFVLLPIGLFCDIIDGWVARKRYSSPFGGDLDSLADLISFGVAPACLGFTLGLRGIWDSVCLIVFVLCGLSRLARFNVTADILSEGDASGKVKFFEGVPIPCSLGIVTLLFVAWLNDRVGSEKIYGGQWEVYPGHFHPLSLIFLAHGILMVSQVRVPKP